MFEVFKKKIPLTGITTDITKTGVFKIVVEHFSSTIILKVKLLFYF